MLTSMKLNGLSKSLIRSISGTRAMFLLNNMKDPGYL